jgi:hypothetical protein
MPAGLGGTVRWTGSYLWLSLADLVHAHLKGQGKQ